MTFRWPYWTELVFVAGFAGSCCRREGGRVAVTQRSHKEETLQRVIHFEIDAVESTRLILRLKKAVVVSR